MWNVWFCSGTGASCIYPLLAAKKFQWSMVGTDINKESIENANSNVKKNNLQDLIQGNCILFLYDDNRLGTNI